MMKNPIEYNISASNADADFLNTILNDGGMEVLSTLAVSSLTATEVSRSVGLPLAKVNYIIKLLEQNKLIYIDSIRAKDDFVENAYKADIDSFGIQLGNHSSEMEKINLITYMIEAIRSGMIDAVSGSTPADAEFGLVKAKIPKDRIKDYIQQLRNLEYEIDTNQESGGESYTFAVSLFPNSQ